MRRYVAIILTLLFVLGAFCSCARIDDDGAKTLVADLMTRAYVLNEIYYGEGLPYNEDEHYQGNYYYVTEDAKYRIRNDLLVETKAVFSPSMADEIIKIYFSGTQSLGVPIYARYMVGETGYLVVDKDYKNSVPRVYQYDTSTIEIKKIKRNEIKATIKAIIPEGDTTAPFSIEVVLTYSKDLDGWRIDSPTY